MTTEIFAAGTHYNDYSGSVSADDRDLAGLHHYFRENGTVGAGEYLVGVEMHSRLTAGSSHDGTVEVRAFIASVDRYETAIEMIESGKSLSVRKVDVQMTFIVFFSLFKHLSLTLSTKSMLEGREISY